MSLVSSNITNSLIKVIREFIINIIDSTEEWLPSRLGTCGVQQLGGCWSSPDNSERVLS